MSHSVVMIYNQDHEGLAFFMSLATSWMTQICPGLTKGRSVRFACMNVDSFLDLNSWWFRPLDHSLSNKPLFGKYKAMLVETISDGTHELYRRRQSFDGKVVEHVGLFTRIRANFESLGNVFLPLL